MIQEKNGSTYIQTGGKTRSTQGGMSTIGQWRQKCTALLTTLNLKHSIKKMGCGNWQLLQLKLQWWVMEDSNAEGPLGEARVLGRLRMTGWSRKCIPILQWVKMLQRPCSEIVICSPVPTGLKEVCFRKQLLVCYVGLWKLAQNLWWKYYEMLNERLQGQCQHLWAQSECTYNPAHASL